MQRLVIFLLLLVALLLSGCGAGPKEQAKKWAERFPEEIESTNMDWDLENRRTELTAESQASYGYITLTYEGDDDINAFVTIVVYANENAADVALDDEMLDYRLQGARFEEHRIRLEQYKGNDRNHDFNLAAFSGSLLAIYQVEETLFTVRFIAEDPTTPIPLEDVDSLLAVIAEIVVNIDD